MRAEKTEPWRDLCPLIVDEKDPERLLKLVKEVARLLEEKEARLKKAQRSMSKAGD